MKLSSPSVTRLPMKFSSQQSPPCQIFSGSTSKKSMTNSFLAPGVSCAAMDTATQTRTCDSLTPQKGDKPMGWTTHAQKPTLLLLLLVYVLYIRPLILYGTTDWFTNRINLEKLESFQSRVTRGITSYDTYKERLIQSNFLSPSLLFQLEDLLTFNKVLNGKLGPEFRSLIEPSKAPRQNLRETSFPFKLQKTRLKLTDSNFIHRATRLANFVSMKHNI